MSLHSTLKWRSPPLPALDWALFLDVDGTLLDIASSPDSVVVPPSLLLHLRALHQHLGGALALVSGRPVADLDSLFAPLRLPAAGQHGSEWRDTGSDLLFSLPASPLLPALHALGHDLQNRFPGLLAEHKTLGVALHYRHAPQAGEAVRAALAALLEQDPGLELIPGQYVWEARSRSANKGVAVQRFMADPAFQGRKPVFLGDDHTDFDGFRAARALGGLALPVGERAHRESGEAAPAGFADAAAVRAWLARFYDTTTDHHSNRIE